MRTELVSEVLFLLLKLLEDVGHRHGFASAAIVNAAPDECELAGD